MPSSPAAPLHPGAGGSGGSAATRDSSRSRFLSHVAVGDSGGRNRPDAEDAGDYAEGATSGSHLAA